MKIYNCSTNNILFTTGVFEGVLVPGASAEVPKLDSPVVIAEGSAVAVSLSDTQYQITPTLYPDTVIFWMLFTFALSAAVIAVRLSKRATAGGYFE